MATDYFKKVAVTAHVPHHVENPQKFIQSRINNFGYFEKGLNTKETKISPTDIDGVVHLTDDKGEDHFLFIETKVEGAKMPKGQQILIEALGRQKNTNVIILYYKEDDVLFENPYAMHFVGKNGIGRWQPTSTKDQEDRMRRWKQNRGR